MNGPSGNANAVLAKRRREKLTGLWQNNSRSAITQHDVCAHKFTVTQQERPGGTHYSREVCIQCGAFIRWLPKPVNVGRRKVNGFRLTKLMMRDDLDPWSRNFLKSLARQKHFSPRQQKVFDELVAKYLEGAR
jgi:hypothetical protein